MIDSRELEFEYYKSPGPGGQNVNKVSTAVRLRFYIASSKSLAQDVKDRLTRLVAARITIEGELIIDAHRYRTREQNRQDAIECLEALVVRCTVPPKKRHQTRPTKSSVEKRLEAKRRRGQIKQGRSKEE